ncbi:MAG TPA: glycoside hydrolase family 36 protein [Propionibacteriaceae bacterium]|nr:glycoside hydrolase family 36 protein [Propionibacteriaceae bacterium]
MTQTLTLGHERLSLELTVRDDRSVGYTRLSADGIEIALNPGQSLVEVLTVEDGHTFPSERLLATAVGERLRYVGHSANIDGGRRLLDVQLSDPVSQLAVTIQLSSWDGVAAVTMAAHVTNAGAAPRTLQTVTSLTLGLGAESSPVRLEDVDLLSGTSEWLSESRWSRRPAREMLRDLDRRTHAADPRWAASARSLGTWSTGGDLPVGGLMHTHGDFAVLWQIEHNGGWRWEVGQGQHGCTVGLTGPTDLDHSWTQTLKPGESFQTVTATLGVGTDLDSALGELTDHRRRARRPHPDNAASTLVFNDYMNTLMGDPTTEKLLPLITSAAAVGAEVFCIDAGWYDDGGNWWPSVGAWQPSTVRFPGGLGEVIQHIGDAGMVAGLWLEPEVVGVDSPVADTLPAEAFLTRNGVRIREAQRFHLDLSHPAARGHLDEVVDRLVGEFGVGYFKMDYNINPGAGSDRDGVSPGAGLLRHNRAQLAWLDSVLDRHPSLIIENCSSGAMRMDPALMSRLQLQSTSDQQNPVRYATIAAAAPLSILPEQAGNWAYPSAEMDAETTAFTLANGILGRLYLSGYLNRLDSDQLRLVAQAVAVHKRVRPELSSAYPSWPLDLPGWDDPVVALALNSESATYLTLWRRSDTVATVSLSLPSHAGEVVQVETLFPAAAPSWASDWDPATALLTVEMATASPSARILRIVTRTESEWN